MIRFSEYVSIGHPDKIADYISQYLLDRYIEHDPQTRYAVEVQIKDWQVTLGGAKKRNDVRTYQYAASILEQYLKTFGDERRRFRRKCERLIVKHLRPATPTVAE